MTAPMTAAEYREANRTALGMYPGGWTVRILAALEEREALLEQAKFGSADASVGALVRRIRVKRRELFDATGRSGNFVIGVGEPRVYFLVHHDDGFEAALSHLDSLLPKEPEVAPSGWTYERVTDSTHYWRIAESGLSFSSATATCIPPIDREYVEKLMEASRGK